MQLVGFRVQKFRNIIDSDDIGVENNVTCLVGKNESGKTAILNALYRLNPAYDAEFDIAEHYPRWLMTADRKAGLIDAADAIRGTFELDDDDVSAVEERFGRGVLKDRLFSFTRGYKSTRALLKIDEVVAVKWFLTASAAGDEAIKIFNSETFDGLRSQIDAKLLEFADDVALIDLVAQIAVLKDELAKAVGELTLWQLIVSILRDRIPKFFYFSQYSVLPGRIDLSAIDQSAEGPGASGMQTARALLELAGTSKSSLSEENYEERTAELEAVSNDLTAQVFNYWSQNEQLEVQIDVDKQTVATSNGQTAVAKFLDVRVKDRRHGFTSNFSQRSAGFQWFFSFLAAFSEFEGKAEKVVVLLDEPGLALHAKAQADFLRFIDERLAPSVQVVYTTHSPFMIESGKLERVRVVEDKGAELGTVVSSEVLSVSKDTLFPLQAALGYDIAQNLFIGPDNLLVEGTSDYTFLTVMSDHLKSLGRVCLDESWRVLPTGGVSNVPSFVALMGRSLDVTVFVDSGADGLQRLHSLAARGLLKEKRLITVDQITETKNADIEDLFSPGDYLKLYNPAFKTSLTVAKLPAGDRLIDRISRAQGSDFVSHGLPADFLLRNRDRILDSLTDSTLSNFEEAIKAINATRGT